MTPVQGRRGAAGLLVGAAGLLVPRAEREEWLREWNGELDAAAEAGRAVVRPALGAFRHAAFLRGEAWARSAGAARREAAVAARGLGRRPSFSAAVVTTLALGIGAGTAVFGVVDRVLTAPLPYPGGDRFVEVTATYVPWDVAGVGVNPRLFLAWDGRAATLEPLHGFAERDLDLVGGGPPAMVRVAEVTDDFLAELLAVAPVAGRSLRPDDVSGDGGAALVSEGLWARRWARDPGVIGRTVRLGGRPVRIVGVLPEVAILPEVDVWRPFALAPRPDDRVRFGPLRVLTRRRPGASVEAVERELAEVSRRAGDAVGGSTRDFVAHARDFRTALVGDVRRDLLVVAVAVAAVLLIACGNVAHLLLFRGADRRRELLVRASLGASRGDLVRAVLAEGAVLGLLGGGLGVLLAAAADRAISAGVPADIPLATGGAGLDARTLVLALALTAAAVVLSSGVPALRAGRLAAPRPLHPGATAGRGRSVRSSLLLGLEVAQASALLVAALLVVGSLVRMSRADSGFRPEGLLFAKVDLPRHAYGPTEETGSRERFVSEVRERLRATPGVRTVALATGSPFAGMTFLTAMDLEGGPRPGATDGGIRFVGQEGRAAFSQLWVDPDYLDVLGLPVVEGRGLRASDAGGEPVAVVNETAARAYWPGESPVGRRLRLDDARPWIRVVGVVRDFGHPGLPTAGQAELYQLLGSAGSTVTALVRFEGEPGALRERVRRAVWAVDPDLPVPAVRTAGEALSASLALTRFYAALLATFGGLAALLAAVGIYGVVSCSVARRVREMGIRIALGARPPQVVRAVLLGGMTVVAAGLAAGLAGGALGARLLQGLLYGLGPGEPRVYVAVAALMTAASALAAWIPARRATRADPASVLRAE